MNADRHPVQFFGLVMLFSLPFYALGMAAPLLSTLMPAHLPISALMFVCPLLAAIYLTRRDEGTAGLRRLLGRTFDWKRGQPTFLLMALLMMPAVMLLSYAVQRLLGLPLPDAPFPFAAVVPLFTLYFLGAIGEELGWMGYAIDPLQELYGPLKAALILGLVWWLWHVIPYFVMGRSWEWVLWAGLATIANRVLMVWIYNRAGQSVFTAVLYHTLINVTYSVFPIEGSHYDPLVTGLILAGLTILVCRRDPTLGQSKATTAP